MRQAFVFAIFLWLSAGDLSFGDDTDWWKYTTFYQIYPRSFKDSDADGTGDLQGIMSQLDYFVELGIDAVWMNPIYDSPQVDFGYDISNYTSIDPMFGTMDDFDNMLAEMKSRGIRLVMDFVPNHSSINCSWFEQSVQSIEPYTDYYVWANATYDNDGNRLPPNNWISNFDGSAWEWREERQQYYLHQFAVEQADFNFYNPDVIEELSGVIRFWLDKGIDGLRMDAVAYMLEDPNLDDESPSGTTNDTNSYDYLYHNLTFNYPGDLNILYQWRQVLDEYSSSSGSHKVMITEAYLPVSEIMAYYGNSTYPLSDVPFNFFFIDDLTAGFTAADLSTQIGSWLDNMPEGDWANWVLGNHDNSRVATRLGSDEIVDGLNMVLLLLPGTAFTYYGEEIGMNDTYVPPDEVVDVNDHRDPERTPFQWNDGFNAGFSDGNTTWLPINSNYLTVNVDNEESEDNSHYLFYKGLLQLRNDAVIQTGSFSMSSLNDDQVFAFSRCDASDSDNCYFAVFNTGSDDETVDISSLTNSDTVTLRHVLKSVNCDDQNLSTESSNALSLGAYNAIVYSSSVISSSSTSPSATSPTSTSPTSTSLPSTTPASSSIVYVMNGLLGVCILLLLRM